MKRIYCDLCGNEISYESSVVPVEKYPKYWIKLILQASSPKFSNTDDSINTNFDLCKDCATRFSHMVQTRPKELHEFIWNGFLPKSDLFSVIKPLVAGKSFDIGKWDSVEFKERIEKFEIYDLAKLAQLLIKLRGKKSFPDGLSSYGFYSYIADELVKRKKEYEQAMTMKTK